MEKVIVLSLLSEDVIPAKVAERLKKPRSSIQRYLDSFREASLVDDKNVVTDIGRRVLVHYGSLIASLEETLKDLKRKKETKDAYSAVTNLIMDGVELKLFSSEELEKLKEVRKMLERKIPVKE